MLWRLSDRFDPCAVALADRHYSRQKPGTPQFVAPGRNVVLVTTQAVWVSLWQAEEWTRHAWPGAWLCSMFRNESQELSSKLIRDACSATRWVWGDPPAEGMLTFVDPQKVSRKRDPGRCFLRAGFVPAGRTKGGLIALQMPPEAFPEPASPAGAYSHLMCDLFDGAA